MEFFEREMSWLKGAFDKVKEKGAVVKGIARDVAYRTKEVRSRLMGASTASELEVCKFQFMIMYISPDSTRDSCGLNKILPRPQRCDSQLVIEYSGMFHCSSVPYFF